MIRGANNMKQCFISHCSEDRDLLVRLHDIIDRNFDKTEYEFFNTSFEERSTFAGQGLSDALRIALDESEIMIALITDNYLRSPICLAEISAFWYTNKPVIPIVYSVYGAGYLKEVMGKTVIYVDLAASVMTEKTIGQRAEKMAGSMVDAGFIPFDMTGLSNAFMEMFRDVRPGKAKRCYIGSNKEYENINKYCEEYGISVFRNSSRSSTEIISRVRGCKTLYIVSTTGSSLIANLSSEFIPAALAQGTDIVVLIPNRYSSYVNDVAEVESPQQTDKHRIRFAREFEGVVYNLKECIRRARRNDPSGKGGIYIGCTHNLLRQTVTLAEFDDRLWGWMSITMPPKRTVDGTPSFEFSGEKNQKNKKSMAGIVYEHVISMRDVAIRRGNYVCLEDNEDFTEFYLENEGAESYWRDLYEHAKSNMLSYDGESDLIEVAAQHPLLSSGKPAKEFAARLDKAAEVYRKLEEQGQHAVIYVPGSLHRYRKNVNAPWKTDPCSLSHAGVEYLKSKGIPEEDLLGEEENQRYKGELGVYNTADECYVASKIFEDGDYRRLHCVCSPNQLIRKKLFYIAFGVIPYYHTVSSENMAHDDIHELFHSIPEILSRDHTWQGEDSVNGNRTRRERNPELDPEN